MTPGARLAAAIGVLDRIGAGRPAEAALLDWSRGSRYAGSGDRRAVRDHVFDALRRRRSYAWLGGSEDGRGLILGALRAAALDPATLFTGIGHAPPSVAPEEAGQALEDAPDPVRLDCPDWLWERLGTDLGADREAVLEVLRDRAQLTLRVNLRRADRDQAADALAAEGIATVPSRNVRTALHVIGGERKIQGSTAFSDGLVELQDAASQAAVLRLPLRDGMRVLDYCAGGGGKTLAMGALADLTLAAHDALPKRMADLPARALRAGLRVDLLPPGGTAQQPPSDLVLVDAPCSGSGTWRRSPDAKWRFAPADLDRVTALQDEILAAASACVAPGGSLAYATCSILKAENADRVTAFLAARPGWRRTDELVLLPTLGHDGFYLCVLAAPGAS